MSDGLETELERARRVVEKLEAIQRERENPAHEHEWYDFDGSRHCFKCRTTEHQFARAAGPGGAP